MLVDVVSSAPAGVSPSMISLLDVDAGAVGSVCDLREGLFEVAVGGVDGLAAVGGGLGVGGGVGDGDRDQLGVVAAGDVDRDVEGAQRDLRAVPGEQDSLKHQRKIGISVRARIRATNMYSRYTDSRPDWNRGHRAAIHSAPTVERRVHEAVDREHHAGVERDRAASGAAPGHHPGAVAQRTAQDHPHRVGIGRRPVLHGGQRRA